MERRPPEPQSTKQQPTEQHGDLLDGVFKALADPTRRALLDALFALDGQTVQALCDGFPNMTRFGVMKHLGVLEQANLITTHRVGRTKLHHLNTVPIGQIADRWISKYSQPFTRSLVGLANGLEQQVERRLEHRLEPEARHDQEDAS